MCIIYLTLIELGTGMTYSKEQLALKAYIETDNAEFIKQAKAHGATGWATYTSDIDHWAESDVYTVEQFKRYAANDDYYELYLSLYDSKPSYDNYRELTLEEITVEINSMCEKLDLQAAQKIQRKKDEQAKVVARKKANSYQPNNAFSGLKNMLSA